MRSIVTTVLTAGLLAGCAGAVCEPLVPKLCNVYFNNDLVVRAVVARVEPIVDKDDPGETSGWQYHLQVKKTYRGRSGKKVIVYSENTDDGVMLEKDGDYIVFASKIPDGDYAIWNYSNGVQGMNGERYSPELESRIQQMLRERSATIEGQVVDKNGRPKQYGTITIVGNGAPLRLPVAKDGSFKATVEPGKYRIDMPKDLQVSSCSSPGEDADPQRGKEGPHALVAGQCLQVKLQERK